MDEHLLVFCSWEWKVMYLEHIWIKLFRFLFKHRKYDQFHIWKAVCRVVRTLASKPRGSIPVDLYLFMMNLAIICPNLISYMQHHISYQRKKTVILHETVLALDIYLKIMIPIEFVKHISSSGCENVLHTKNYQWT